MCTVLLPPGDNPIAVNKYMSLHDDRSEGTQVLYFNLKFNVMDINSFVLLRHKTISYFGPMRLDSTRLGALQDTAG